MNIFGIIYNYVINNWADLVQIYLQLIGLASIIVKLTPTLKDDDALKGLIKFMGKYVALNSNKGNTP